MKKTLVFLMTALLCVSLLISCNDQVSPNGNFDSRTVKMQFSASGNSLTKGLSAVTARPGFSTLDWYYTANKSANDPAPDFKEGVETTATKLANGLETVITLSQGYWDFKLWAMTSGTDFDANKAIYAGEANAVKIEKKSNDQINSILVMVTAQSGEDTVGKLVIAQGITINLADGTTNTLKANHVEIVKGSETKTCTDLNASGNTEFEVVPGNYTVYVSYEKDGFTFAKAKKAVTINSGMTTTISGSIDEIDTAGKFEPQDVTVNASIQSRHIAATGSATQVTEIDGSTNYTSPTDTIVIQDTSETKAKAELQVKSASTIINNLVSTTDLAVTTGTDKVDTTKNREVTLTLNVQTTDVTPGSVKYEINVKADMTYTTVGGETKTIENQEIGTIDEYVTATIELPAGLHNVVATHNGEAMENMNSASDIPTNVNGGFHYDSSTGILTIKSKTFSPFQVSYEYPVAKVGAQTYQTLVDAVAAAKNGQTVTLLRDFSGAGIFVGANTKSITINLGGNIYTCNGPAVGSAGTETQAFHLEKDNTITIENGKITSTPGSGVKMLVQNYSNLTLNNVTLDGENIGKDHYVLSNNNGDTVIKGSTSITAPDCGVALDCYYWPKGGYPEGVSVKFDENFTGKITGKIEFARDDSETEVSKHSLYINDGDFTDSSVVIKSYNKNDVVKSKNKNISLTLSGVTYSWTTDPDEDSYYSLKPISTRDTDLYRCRHTHTNKIQNVILGQYYCVDINNDDMCDYCNESMIVEVSTIEDFAYLDSSNAWMRKNPGNTKYKLMADITCDKCIFFSSGTTLDLNGHTFTHNGSYWSTYSNVAKTELNFTDSSLGGEKGKIVCKNYLFDLSNNELDITVSNGVIIDATQFASSIFRISNNTNKPVVKVTGADMAIGQLLLAQGSCDITFKNCKVTSDKDGIVQVIPQSKSNEMDIEFDNCELKSTANPCSSGVIFMQNDNGNNNRCTVTVKDSTVSIGGGYAIYTRNHLILDGATVTGGTIQTFPGSSVTYKNGTKVNEVVQPNTVQ